MRKLLAGLGGSTGGMIAAAGVVVVLGGAAALRFGAAPEGAGVALVSPDPGAMAPGAAQPAVPDTPQAAPLPALSQDDRAAPAQAAVSEITPPAFDPPAFDEVRREADGMTVIAGRGAPQTGVAVLLDGQEVATARTDGRGKFATLVMIPPGGAAHVLSLLQRAGGAEQRSVDEIILAPLAAASAAPVAQAPVATAQAEVPAAVRPAPSVAGEPAPAEPLALATAAPADTPPAAPQEEAERAPSAQPASPAVTAEAPAALPTAPPAAQASTAAAPPQAVAPQTVVPRVQAEIDPAAPPAAAAVDTAAAPGPAPAAPKPAPAAPKPAPAPEPAAVAVLKATPEGVELLNPPMPQVMENIALDTISYSEGGAVQLTGRAQSETQAVRVYLDNNAIISLPVDAAGRWRGDLPDVAEGIYTLRVDEVAQDGSVSSRVETPFKREAPAALAAAAAAQDGPIKAITVQKGATLWAIARDRYGSGALFVRVFEANAGAIRDPDLIYPGQVFDLPD